MSKKGDNRKPPSQPPNERILKAIIGIGFLTALMLFLFWPVLRDIVSFVLG